MLTLHLWNPLDKNGCVLKTNQWRLIIYNVQIIQMPDEKRVGFFFSIQDCHAQGEDPIKKMGKGVVIMTELQPKPFPPVSTFRCVQLDYIWKLVTEINILN